MVTFGIVSAWVLIPLANQNSAVFSVPQGTEKLYKSIQGRLQAKIIPTCWTFNNNIYTDFRTVYKHVLSHSYVIQVI